MKISSAASSANISSLNECNKTVKNVNKKAGNSFSFKAIYVENDVRLGNAALSHTKPKFLYRDALLLNDIASMYPNQDCFIRSDKSHYPRLEYREKPPEVAIFYENYSKSYEQDILPKDKTYPCVPLILYPESKLSDFIGVPSSRSYNPSLPYTIKAGYEVHKKIMEKKYQIMDVIGPVDYFDLGEQTVIDKAHDAIEDVESSVTRYLMECAYTSLTHQNESEQFYASNIPQVQTWLNTKRRIDLTTPTAKQPVAPHSEDRKDICEMTSEEYPNMEENRKEIEQIVDDMKHYKLYLN